VSSVSFVVVAEDGSLELSDVKESVLPGPELSHILGREGRRFDVVGAISQIKARCNRESLSPVHRERLS
jgi:hypothetical protein